MYYFFALIVIFALSKELYIINEESLVALSFVTFIFISYNAISSLVSAELDSRSDQIRKEFQFFVSARENALEILLAYHKKQIALFEEIVSLVELLKTKIKQTMELKEIKLQYWMIAQQKAKLTSLLQKERALLVEWREKTVEVFSAKVIEETTKTAPFRARLLKESIEYIEKEAAATSPATNYI